jgi:SseB protein C-terminal domain
MSKPDQGLGAQSRDLRVQRVHFVGEQDGRPERELKGRLAEVLRGQSKVLRAYLARVAHGDRSPVVVALCIRTRSNPDAALLERLSEVFASMFSRNQHLDILFLDDVHEATLASCCKPFYVTAPRARGV